MDKPVADRLIGTIVAGRYRLDALSEPDELGSLYKGIDLDSGCVVGIRVTPDAHTHRRLQEWLGQAVLSRGKDAILAAGHIDADRAYVIFAEAALEYILAPATEATAADKPHKQAGIWHGFVLWRKSKGGKSP